MACCLYYHRTDRMRQYPRKDNQRKSQETVDQHYYKSIAKGAGKGFRDGAVALFK